MGGGEGSCPLATLLGIRMVAIPSADGVAECDECKASTSASCSTAGPAVLTGVRRGSVGDGEDPCPRFMDLVAVLLVQSMQSHRGLGYLEVYAPSGPEGDHASNRQSITKWYPPYPCSLLLDRRVPA